MTPSPRSRPRVALVALVALALVWVASPWSATPAHAVPAGAGPAADSGADDPAADGGADDPATDGGADDPATAAVIGGVVAAPGTWPSVVALLAPSGTPAQAQYCGGTLVDPSWVLTAAHCVTEVSFAPTSIRVLTGTQDLATGGQILSVTQAVAHPGWQGDIGSGHDLALLRLAAPAPGPVAELFTPGSEPDWGVPGSTSCAPGRCGWVAGWGLTSQSPPSFPDLLQEAQVGIYTDAECLTFQPLFVVGEDLCVGYAGINVCRGDSGGPLVALDAGGRLRVAGVVSYGLSTCTASVSVFTRVASADHSSWIRGWLQTTAGATVPGAGYWVASATGTVYAFGDVAHHGDVVARSTVTDVAPTPSGDGYWVLEADGTVHARGDALFLGHRPALAVGEQWSGIAATPTGDGYWLFSSRGRVAAFGTAPFRGDLTGLALNGPVIDAVATPSGQGYYMLATDGGVFAFGDAAFFGSMGGSVLNQPVRGLVPDPDGDGYWLVAGDGGVFAFQAGFRGSVPGALAPGQSLARPVVGMVPFGDGYLMVASDGGVFNFSTQPFSGSLGGVVIPAPIVAVAAHSGG